jgi:hypothetical protein
VNIVDKMIVTWLMLLLNAIRLVEVLPIIPLAIQYPPTGGFIVPYKAILSGFCYVALALVL